MPDYVELSKSEKRAEYDKEKNKTVYLSSAYWIDNWSFTKCKDVFKSMILDDKRSHFVCGLPYQLSIKEGLLDADTVEDEMSESDFNEIKFSINNSVLIKPIRTCSQQGVLLTIFGAIGNGSFIVMLTGET